MSGFARPLKVLGIVAAVLALFLVISIYFSFRHSLVLWVVVFSPVLPLAFWFRLGLMKWCAASLLIAFALAISPIDIVIMRSDKSGVHLLPVNYGIGCQPGTACFGCVVMANPPRKALVFSY